ncbi:VOC family protein [Aggregatilinea lenta]|uniref:VOC family protein n=1 Tax=Aggregatilinea lenta TaxID=913108 RepID=UPI000E5C1F5F|nr:VOC family protein [Aggregatilinea lenta]
MQRITPFLWFDNQAEEAAHFYVSIFRNAKILDIRRYTEAGPAPAGTVMTASFSLDGQEFVALNGGPQYQFTPAISFYVDCESQEEVDRLWNALLDGGQPVQCGWITDKYGVSWQIVPSVLNELMQNASPEQALRVTEALFKMVKIDVAGLQKAYAG